MPGTLYIVHTSIHVLHVQVYVHVYTCMAITVVCIGTAGVGCRQQCMFVITHTPFLCNIKTCHRHNTSSLYMYTVCLSIQHTHQSAYKSMYMHKLYACTYIYMRKGLGIFLENCEKPVATRGASDFSRQCSTT